MKRWRDWHCRRLTREDGEGIELGACYGQAIYYMQHRGRDIHGKKLRKNKREGLSARRCGRDDPLGIRIGQEELKERWYMSDGFHGNTVGGDGQSEGT